MTLASRFHSRFMVVALCALSLAFFGCSKTKIPRVIDPIDPGKVLSGIDSLVKANKGKGKGVVTGFISGEGKSVASGILNKQAANAAGERRFLRKTEIPLTGATVLIFNALKPTTAADTTVKTDTAGNYTAVLADGKYFGFAVYLDLQTFQLVTTSIPNINPVMDTVLRMDTAVAIEDVTAPTVSGVYDASSPNDNNVFMVGSVSDTEAKINITFSEPMNRESAKGVVLGRVDTSSTATTVTLVDTVKDVTIAWSGDSKELTLTAKVLKAGTQYGAVIPVSLKDLAKNALEKEFKATFVAVSAASLASVKFAVAASFPAAGDTLKPIQNPGISFNRPVEGFSLIGGAKIEPSVTGYWEVAGSRAVFIHKDPLEVGKSYKITLPGTTKDISGQTLGSDFNLSFSVKDFDGAAKDKSGVDLAVALSVEAMFNAYLQGDLGRFGAAFHPNFRLFEGNNIQSKTQFLDGIRKDVAEHMALRAGIPAPFFDNDSTFCKEGGDRWKVKPVGGADADFLWVDAYTSMGSVPRVWSKSGVLIDRAKLEWDRTGPRFTYEGKKYGFAPDFSQFTGGINMDAARDDLRFMGDVMMKTSSLVLDAVKLESKEEFKVDGSMLVVKDTARLAVKMITEDKFSRTNFRSGCHPQGDTGVHYQILKFLLVNDGTRWLVHSITAPAENISKDNFNQSVDVSKVGATNIQPITLVAPINGKDRQADASGKVTFKFNGIKHDSVGGYIVGLAEDPKFIGSRPPFGTLIFVKASNKTGGEESFVLSGEGKLEGTNATGILRKVQDLHLPGWERTFFEYSLTKLFDTTRTSLKAGVYLWKTIAVKDTSAAQFLGNGFVFSRFYGESDFGPNRGYFAVMTYPQGAAFDQFNNQVNIPPTGGTGGSIGFGDMDQDGFPDQIELKYKTRHDDRNSYPDFRVDTDGDKLADFLEKLIDATGKDSLIEKKADPAQYAIELGLLKGLGIIWEDSDSDGFPDDIEQMMGFNPRDPMNNPGTRVRAQVPIGVFAGKIQMGTVQNSASFKLYQDSLKNLLVAYTVSIGKDTIVDTARAGFNEIAGEVMIAINLPKNGPDSGRALLLRGRYDANMSLLMGPVDMITAMAKTSVNFGGGPNVGQFAASGRGEDVSRYLPGGTGGTGGGTVCQPGQICGGGGPAVGPTYRPPPQGVAEGSQFIFQGTKVILINEFKDTVAVVENATFRSQPDGSWEFNAQTQKTVNNVNTRTETGGRISLAGDSWILDGHLFQETDSAGIHRSIPGQICAKAPKANLKANSTGGLEGTLTGWIAQDKSGGGFVNPVNPGGCVPGTPNCPVNPGNSFNKPFMQGIERVQSIFATENVQAGATLYVAMGGRVMTLTNDSLHILAAKFPWCGQVVIRPSLIPLKAGAPATELAAFSRDSAMLAMQGNMVILLEDQYVMGKLARIEKILDAQGEVRMNVLVVESRPTPPDYGNTSMQCPSGGGGGGGGGGIQMAIFAGPIEPIKAILVASQNVGLWLKDNNDPGTQVKLDPASLKPDAAIRATFVAEMGNPTRTFVFMAEGDPMKLLIRGNLPVLFEKGMSGGGGGGGGGGTGPNLFSGNMDAVKQALVTSGNSVVNLKDPANPTRVNVDPGTVKVDSIKRVVIVKESNGTRLFVFLGETDATRLLIKDGAPAVGDFGSDPGSGGTGPVYFSGDKAALDQALSASASVGVMIKDSAGTIIVVGTVELNAQSVKMDSLHKAWSIMSVTGKLHLFAADVDPMKLRIRDGKPVVVPALDGGGGGGGGGASGPTAYSGPLSDVKVALEAKFNKVKVMVPPPNNPTDAVVNPGTLASNGGVTMAADANNGAKFYVFLGMSTDPGKLMMTPDGSIAVIEKPITTSR